MDRNPRLGTVQANGEQNLHASRRPSSDRVFATIRLVNNAGMASMNDLGQDYYNLSYHNRKRLNIGHTGRSFFIHFVLLRFSYGSLVFLSVLLTWWQ